MNASYEHLGRRAVDFHLISSCASEDVVGGGWCNATHPLPTCESSQNNQVTNTKCKMAEMSCCSLPTPVRLSAFIILVLRTHHQNDRWNPLTLKISFKIMIFPPLCSCSQDASQSECRYQRILPTIL